MSHFVQTGARAEGIVKLADGTEYDVTPGMIEVASEEHGRAVAFHIARQHERTGFLTTLLHGPDWTGAPARIQGDESEHWAVGGDGKVHRPQQAD